MLQLSRQVFLTFLFILWAASAHAWTQSQFVIGTWWDPTVSNTAPYDHNSSAAQADIDRFNVAKIAFFNLFTGRSNYPNPIGGDPGCWRGTNRALGDYLLWLGSQTGVNLLIASPGVNLGGDTTFYPDTAANIVQHYLNELDAGPRSAFYGYSLRDEPGTVTPSTQTTCGGNAGNDFGPSSQEYAGYFRAHDPGRLTYINLRPKTTLSAACYIAYVNDYLNPPDPAKALDVASFDCYPFLTNQPFEPSYFTTMGIVRRAAGARPMWAYPLVTNNASFIPPQDEHLRFMVFSPLAYGAKGIVYFTYVIPNCTGASGCEFCAGTALVDSDGDTTGNFGRVRTINRYITNIVAPMVMTSTWLGAYHKSRFPTSVEALSPEWLINDRHTPIVAEVSDSGALIGLFNNNNPPQSTCHLLLVNKRVDQAANMTVTLKGNFVNRVTVAPSVVGYTGSTTYTAVSVTYNPTTNRSSFATGSVAAGEGKLYELTGIGNRYVATMRTDFDGDGKADASVFSNGQFKIDYSSTNLGSPYDYTGAALGAGNPVPSDYDGDGRSDLSIKTDAGVWSIDYAWNGFNGWDVSYSGYGGSTTYPVPADYDGDGKADLAIKTDTGAWKIDYAANGFGSGGGFDAVIAGLGDATWTPLVGDFDGDGKADLSVANGTQWKIDYSNDGFTGLQVTVTLPTNHIVFDYVPADYDGDGKYDLGLFTSDVGPKHGWQIDYAADGFGNWTPTVYVSKGLDAGSPTPADYDGDWKTDFSTLTMAGSWRIDYAANGRGTWDATYTGYGSGPGLFQQQANPSGAPLPERLSLSASPNPFGGGTTIHYALTRSGQVRIAIYDVSGQRVLSLLDRNASAGVAAVEWRGTDTNGRRVPAGVYFCRLEAEGRRVSRKLILTR